MKVDWPATVIGFIGGIGILAGLVFVIGGEELLNALLSAEIRPLSLLFVVISLWLLAWGQALRTILKALDLGMTVIMSALTIAAAEFSTNITPFGQAGGQPVTAYVISVSTGCKYERGLAASASVDTLHIIPTMSYAILGLSFFAINRVAFDRNLVYSTIAVSILVAMFVVIVGLGWRYRTTAERLVVRTITPVVRYITQFLPNQSPPDTTEIENRIEAFFNDIDLVVTSRETLFITIFFSAIGWLCRCISLWVSVYALGPSISFAAVLVIVPVGVMAGVAPLPGGLGGVEAAFVALLLSTTGVGASVAGAAVLIHRGATYWLPMIIGGGVALSLGTHSYSV